MRSQRVNAVGPLVADQFAAYSGERLPDSGKIDCRFEAVSPGGGAYNAAREVRRRGGEVNLLALVGMDPLGNMLGPMLRDEFGKQATVLPAMTATRQSLILGDRTFTHRPPVKLNRLPLPILERLDGSISLVAPHSAEDHDFVLHLLLRLPRPVLQLSQSQLSEPNRAAGLARQAHLLILNADELRAWTGSGTIDEGLRVLTESFDLHRVIVTHQQGVTAAIDTQYHQIAAPPVSEVRRTVGAGDAFAGGLCWSLAQGRPWQIALRDGLHSAARHVSTDAPLPPVLPTVAALEPAAPSGRSPWPVHPTLAATLAAVSGLLLGTFLN